MRRAYAGHPGISKSEPIQNGYGLSVLDQVSTIHQAITEFFVQLQPLKTWGLIQKTLGLKEHAAKHRAANHRDYSVEELQMLLHGDNGDQILDLLMKTANPVPLWWQEHQATRTLTYARGLQAASRQLALSIDNAPMEQPTRRKLRKFIDADRTISAARSEAEATVGLRYQNPDRSLDPDIGRVAPASSRALAATAGKTGLGRVSARR